MDSTSAAPRPTTDFVPPHPGSQEMPRWDTGELPAPPKFTWRNWAAMVGPGLVMGGAAIGGGEWLLGPIVTAKYGAAVLWLATLSIVGQIFYNMEISRYTLYTGEPIFTGKFRLLPGPKFWLCVYLLLDAGSIFPYLASNAATPVVSMILGRVPDAASDSITAELLGVGFTDKMILRATTMIVFVGILLPLIFGGKVYNSLKAIMSVKIVVVLGFLTFLAIFYSTPSTWAEILTGFVQVGTVPVESGGPGGAKFDNIFVSLLEGRGFPTIDFSMIGLICAMAAIAGSGGLTNTTISNYTRDQGWGMGQHVGAIPSVIGGRKFSLSHVGKVFKVTPESLSRFRGWYRHVLRDQLVVWTPACFVGLALPSMLSMQFLPRGTEAQGWTAAAMTADGVAQTVGGTWGPVFWYMVLFCGFLVLGPSAATTADGFLRRWVDVFWTASPRMRKIDTYKIRLLYFGVLCCYASVGLVALSLEEPTKLVSLATMVYNYALGFSCWHTLAANLILLPRELRPGWFSRIGIALAGVFFTALAVLTTMEKLGFFAQP